MNDEAKLFILDGLRKTHQDYVQEILKIPSSEIHKQQALFKLEEAHMWMQNAIVNYVAPQAPKQPEPTNDQCVSDELIPIEAPQAEAQPLCQ